MKEGKEGIADRRFFPARSSLGRNTLWIAGVAAIYLSAARLGLTIVVQPEGIAPIWLPSGLFLSALLLTRRNIRTALVIVLCITDFCAEMLAGTPLLVSAAYALVLAGEAVLSSYLLTHFLGEPVTFRKTREMAGFLALVVIISNGSMSLIAAAASGLIPGTSFWTSWTWRVSSDGIGNLLLTPFILSWASSATETAAWNTKRVVEGTALYLPLALLNYFAFGYISNSGLFSLLLPYSTFPFLLWAALRFGIRGVSLALLVLTAIVIPFALTDRIPTFSFYGTPLHDVVVGQLYLVIMAIPSFFLGTVVTERRQAKETLRRSEARLNKAEEIARVGSWELDLTTGRLSWSDEVYRMYGLTPQCFTATYKSFLDVVHPDDRAAVAAAYSGSLREGRDTYEIEHRIVRQFSGEVRFVHEKGEHFRDPSGRIVGSVGMVHDITERKSAEEKLMNSEERYRLIFASNPLPMWVYDRNTLEFIEVNEAAVKNYGYSEEEFRSMTIREIRPPEDVAALEALVSRIAPGLRNSGTWRHRKKDGTNIQVSIHSHDVDLRGRSARLVLAEDVTARQRAEEALRESEARFRAYIEQAGDGFELLDEEGRYVDVNSAACRQLGYAKEELLRLSLFDVDPLLSPERYGGTFRSLIGGSSLTFETVHRRKDGTTFPVEITTSVIPLGSAYRAMTLVRDISERRRTEDERKILQEQLMQSQKLESIGRLAGGIAHDFNNILAAIVGYGNVVQMNMRPEDPSLAMMEQILAAAQRAAGLTQSLLAFSRKQVIHPENIDLNAVVQKVNKFLSRIIGEDVSLSLALCRDSLVIFADTIQVEQVLMNLATNARDAMPKGGTLAIETGRVAFDDDRIVTHRFGKAGEYAMLSVNDTGTGMDDRTQARIFDPFFTTKETGRGTGLGLAIVYGIIKQNNGNIHISSEVGKGTTITVYFPIAASGAVSERSAPALQTIRGGAETILLVEDDVALRELSRRVLSERGYRIVEAGDGDEALAKFQDHLDAIQLIITDIIMPRKSGHDFYEEARKRKPGIKVIFTSGYPTDLVRNAGVLDKETHFLAKPSTPQSLLRKVREMLDQRAG